MFVSLCVKMDTVAAERTQLALSVNVRLFVGIYLMHISRTLLLYLTKLLSRVRKYLGRTWKWKNIYATRRKYKKKCFNSDGNLKWAWVREVNVKILFSVIYATAPASYYYIKYSYSSRSKYLCIYYEIIKKRWNLNFPLIFVFAIFVSFSTVSERLWWVSCVTQQSLYEKNILN